MSKSDADVYADHDDLEMIQRPHLWPHKWILAMKKGTFGTPDFKVGFMLNGEGPVVFLGSFFSDGFNPLTVIEQYDRGEYPCIAYANYEGVVDDGWRVD